MESCGHQELAEAQSKIWSWTFSHLISMSIKCAIHLRIPDLIHNHGPAPATSLSDLISALHVPPTKVHAFGSMMRVLSTRSTGFFTLHRRRRPDDDPPEEEMYSLTPASRLLLSHQPLNQASLPLFHFHPAMRDYCSVLSTWLLEDHANSNNNNNDKRTAFEAKNGKSFWDYVAGPGGGELKGLFHDCMVSDSKLVAEAVLNVSGAAGGGKEVVLSSSLFGGVRSLVDVAGGRGVFAAAVAEAFPDMRCVVLDLPHVVAGLQEGPHPDNLEFIGGDMFRSVPSADAVFLKWILHNWEDERCVKILKCCKQAVSSSNDGGRNGKVIIIDMVLGDQPVENYNDDDLSNEIQLSFDLLMATMINGKERNEKEWKNLFEVAGFSSYKIVGKLGPRSIIEAYP